MAPIADEGWQEAVQVGTQFVSATHLLLELHLLARLFHFVVGVFFHVRDVSVDMIEAHHDSIDELVMLDTLHGVFQVIQTQVRLCQNTVVAYISGHLNTNYE